MVGLDRYFVKRFSFASGWVMGAVGDRVCHQYLVWQAGITDESLNGIGHAVVAMGLDGGRRAVAVGEQTPGRERPWHPPGFPPAVGIPVPDRCPPGFPLPDGPGTLRLSRPLHRKEVPTGPGEAIGSGGLGAHALARHGRRGSAWYG